jgi:excisionase family DNA binding protein
MSNTSPPKETKSLLDLEGAAGYLGDTSRHVRDLVQRRKIAHVRVGGKIRFRISDLDRYIEESIVPAV